MPAVQGSFIRGKAKATGWLRFLARATTVTLLAGFWIAWSAGSAHGSTNPPSFALQSSTASVSRDTFTASVANLTDAPVQLGVSTSGGGDCSPQITAPYGGWIAAKTTTTVSVKLVASAPGCSAALGEKGATINFADLGSAGAQAQPLTVTLAASVHWFWLAIPYVVWTVLAFLLLGATRVHWINDKKWATDDRLPYLGNTYSFKDSWASNATLLLGVVTGILGSTSALGALLTSSNVQTEATISAVISVALIGAAPVVLQILRIPAFSPEEHGAKSSTQRPKSMDYQFTGWGAVAAGSVTLGAACGLVWSIGVLSTGVDVDHWHPGQWWGYLALLPIVLLGFYGIVNTQATLYCGHVPPWDPLAPPPAAGHAPKGPPLAGLEGYLAQPNEPAPTGPAPAPQVPAFAPVMRPQRALIF